MPKICEWISVGTRHVKALVIKLFEYFWVIDLDFKTLLTNNPKLFKEPQTIEYFLLQIKSEEQYLSKKVSHYFWATDFNVVCVHNPTILQ